MTASPTSLRVEELPTVSAMNALQPYPTHTSPSAGSRDVSPAPSLLAPIPNGVRKISGGDATTPVRTILNGTLSTTPITNGTTILLAPGETESPVAQWSSAVGHATTAGKSGRVIERLMTENDKLKRDLELQSLRVQELEKNSQTYRPQIDALMEKVDSLSHASTMDSSLIARRDRRIDELKIDNTHMREGRDSLQRRLREAEKERDDVQDESKRELQSLAESTKHATNHAEILETSHRQLKAEYTARREAWEHDLHALHDERDEQRTRIARYEVVSEQMRVESDRIRKIQAEMLGTWKEYEQVLRDAKDEATESTAQVRKKSVEMEQVVNQMRWVIGVKDAQVPNRDGLPPSSDPVGTAPSEGSPSPSKA